MSDPAPDPQIAGDAETAALFARTASEGPAVDAGALLAQVPLRSRPSSRKRLMMKSMKSAALALTAVGLLGVLLLWPKPAAAVPLAGEIRAALEAVDLMTFTSYSASPDQPDRRTWEFRASVLREPGGGWVRGGGAEQAEVPPPGVAALANWHSGELTAGPAVPVAGAADEWELPRRLLRDPADWTRAGPADDSAWGYIKWFFGGDARGAAKNFREVMLGDAPAVRFESSVRDVSASPRDDRWEPFTVWIDRETRLPLRIEFGPRDGEVGVWTDFTFSAGSADMFGVELPAAVERSLTKTWAATDRYEKSGIWYVHDPLPTHARGFDDPVLTAGVGYGPLRLGMTAAEVEAATGVPTFRITPGGWWFWLPDLGLSARGTDANGLVQIYAGHYNRVDPGVAMVGRTAEGVTAGMSGAEVEARLGPPDLIYRGTPTEGGGRDQFVTRIYKERRAHIESLDDAVTQVVTYAPSVEREPWFRTFLEAVAELDGEPDQ